MNKIQPTIDQGIEYIRISELPLNQFRKFYRWISPTRVFEVENEGKTFNDCVSYGEYEFWFETETYNFTTREALQF